MVTLNSTVLPIKCGPYSFKGIIAVFPSLNKIEDQVNSAWLLQTENHHVVVKSAMSFTSALPFVT